MSIELTICIGICAAAILVWLLAILSSVSMRRLGCLVGKSRQLPINNQSLPPVSVIITTHNQEADLQRNLPLILEQIYPSFEVIVVDIASSDGTKDLLERLEEDHHNLRHTFTPATSRDISQTRLAITLGIKSATHPWVLITQADCAPVSHSWILHMANALTHHRAAQMVLGYTRYEAAGNENRKIQHFNLWQQMQALPYAARHGAYRTGGENLLYSRDLFLQHQGFASHATLLTGATDIMVNRNSTPDNTVVCTHSEAVLTHRAPKEERMWKQIRLFFQETRTHFHRRHLYRLSYACRVLLHALNHLLLALAMAAGIIMGSTNPLWYIATGVAILLGITHFIVQGSCYNHTARLIDNRQQNFLLTAWYISMTPFWDLSSWLRHKFTSSRQFRKKYI